jgi:F-type H+-transporting ATPase subunit a
MRNFYRHIICSLFFFAVIITADAAHNEEAVVEKKFDVKEFIFSHAGDSYGWHITTWGDTHITIPLPIIAYSKEKGWNFFLSSSLHHGEYKGFYIAQEGEYKGKLVERNASGEEVRPLDLSLTKNAAALIINSAILICIVLGMVRWYRKRPPRSVPKGFVGAMEMFIMNIHDDLIKPCVGHKYQRYAPYLLTAFFFILINNMMGLIPFFPGGASTTGNIAVTMTLALCTFFVVNLFGNKEYWKEIFWPDVPVWLKIPVPLMPVVEILGVFTKTFALTIRLFANMLAGHIVILVLVGLIFIFKVMGGAAVASGVSVLSIAFSIFMLALDVLISFIQAYVFTMLSSIFIGLARPEHSHSK